VFFPGAYSPFGPVKRDAFCLLALLQFLLLAVRWAPGWRRLALRLAGVPALVPASVAALFALLGQAGLPGGWRPPAESLDTILGAGVCVAMLAEPELAPAGKMLMALVAGTSLAALYGLAQFVGLDPYLWQASFSGGAPGSVYGNPLFLADGLAVALPCALAAVLVRRGAVRGCAFAAAIVLGLALLATQARGAWLGTAAALLAFGIAARRRLNPAPGGWRLVAGWAGLVAAAGIAFSVPGPHNPAGVSLAEHATALLNPREAGLSGRLLIWEATARMTRDAPLLGRGPGSVRLLYGVYLGPLSATPRFASLPYHSTAHAHDDLLQAFAERGVLGTGVLVWLLAAVAAAWGMSGGARDPARLAAGCGLLAWLVDGLVNGPLHLPPSSMQVWMLLGLLGRRIPARPRDGGAGSRPQAPPARWVLVAAGLAAVVLCRPFARDLLSEGWLAAGSSALDGGAARAALPLVARADAFALEDRRQMFLLGRAWYAAGRWDEAARAFREDGERNPGAFSAWHNAGLAELQMRHAAPALEAFRRALALKPLDRDAAALARRTLAGQMPAHPAAGVRVQR
jgi:O-antigen ligase